MNHRQRVVLWIGAAALVGALIYPPLSGWFPVTTIVLVIVVLILFLKDRSLN